MADAQTTYVDLLSVPFQGLIVAYVVTRDGEDATMDDEDPESEKEYPCLIRITDGKKANLSTHVSPLFTSRCIT